MTNTRTDALPWPVALTVAGSDSGGGAGIQADLKTFQALGVYGASAIAAITAQDTRGVRRIDLVPVDGLVAQIHAVFDDLPVAAVKIGMLATAAHVEAVADALAARRGPPVVLDPVMVATSGDALLEPDAVRAVAERLLPLCALATPNLAEARLLAGASDRASLERWAASLPGAVLLTGGDEGLPEVQDTLVRGADVRRWRARRRPGTFHGTGCTLSSAVAARLALGDELEDAVDRAIGLVQALIDRSFAPGHGARVLPHGLA